MRSGLIRKPATSTPPKPSNPSPTTTTTTTPKMAASPKEASSATASVTTNEKPVSPPQQSQLSQYFTPKKTDPSIRVPMPMEQNNDVTKSDLNEAAALISSDFSMEKMSKMPLQEQMALMGRTLCAINITLGSVNTTLLDLKTANTTINTDFNKLRTDIDNALTSHSTTFETKLNVLEAKFVEDRTIRYTEIMDEIATIKSSSAGDPSTILEIKQDKVKQDLTIQELKDNLEDKEDRLLQLEQLIKEYMESNDCRMTRVEKGVVEAIELANQVEAHGRRWAIRFIGMPAPDENGEKTPEAKHVVLSFLAEKLNITNISPDDIDCAHRIGTVKDKRQTLLVRFFRREIVENVLLVKKNLKGSPVSMFEDSPVKNRTMVWDLNQRAEVESAWTKAGKVWAKLFNIEKKVRVMITDDIDLVLAKYPASKTGPNQKRNPRNQPRIPAQAQETNLTNSILQDNTAQVTPEVPTAAVTTPEMEEPPAQIQNTA